MGQPKTVEQLEADQQASIKLVLGEMERMLKVTPGSAEVFYAWDDARRKVVRRLWTTFKDALAWRPPCACEERADADA